MTEATLRAARQAQREAAFERLDMMVERLRGLSMTRAAALGETSEWMVRRWALQRGHTTLFRLRVIDGSDAR